MSRGLIEIGKKAPAFHLADQTGNKHRLSEYQGKTVVLYFYPKDDTSGCTAQACGFRDVLPKFKNSKAVVFGVSPDDEKSHAKFAGKFDLTFPLLADSQRDDDDEPIVCAKYGVWQEKSMYGRKYMGVVRTTYIIGPNGKIEHRFDKVKPKDHAAEVLAWLKENG